MRNVNAGALKKVLAILFVFVFFCSSALASSVGYVNCSSLVVRSSASTSAKKLGTLSQGTKVKVISTAKGWARISYNGKTGYVSTKYLSKSSGSKTTAAVSNGSKTVAVARTKGYVKTSSYLYQSASASSTKLGVLTKGSPVYVVGKNGSFRKVQTSTGLTGYVKAGNLGKASRAASTKTSKSSKVVSIARSLLGKPYVTGDSGPSAFDCSGLTYYVYSKVGVYLNRNAQSQGYNNGAKISKANLRVGDLVFFNTEEHDGDLCDHVGVYLGSGLFLHASSAAGRVIISSMSMGYYARVFSWGRRVL